MPIRKEPPSEQVSLDDKDLDILRLLQENGRYTVREIAARVHLSATPVHERIKKMERAGAIRQYVALLDHRLVNRSIMAICYVSLRIHGRAAGEAFVNGVKSFPEVIECYNISGDFDFMLKIVVPSMEGYHDFHINKLTNVEGIGQTKSFFVMDVIKDTHKLI